MITARNRALQETAAQAALSVSGVAALQPTLTDRLEAAASYAHQSVRSSASYNATPGIRTCYSPGDGWQIEVRCTLHAGVRVLDTAQHVRAHVLAAVTSLLAQDSMPEPVTVTVTVVRTT